MHTESVLKNVIVEGPIGVGKSSLSHRLATTFNLPLILEKPAENPFLERFYKSPKRYSLPTQLFFLFQRVQQLADRERDQSGSISDFMIAKDPIFASLNLDNEEVALYQQVYQSLSVDAPAPDLMIYLQAPVSVLQKRIKKRSIKYEQRIDAKYLQRLSDAYTEFFHRYDSSPLLIVNAAEFNPIDNEVDYQALLVQIEQATAGKHFFNPLVS